MKKFFAATIALLFAAACGNAMADSNATGSYGGVINSESVFLGTGNHGGTVGSAEGIANNTITSAVFTGPAFNPTRVRFTGTTTSVIAGTWGSEADIRVTNPAGTVFTNWQSNGAGAAYTSFAMSASTNLAAGSGTSAGTWGVEFYESFSDAPGIDATSTNVTMFLEELTASTVADTNGVFTGPTFGAVPGTYTTVGEFAQSFPVGATGNHDRYTFTLGVAGTVDIFTTPTVGFTGLTNGDTEIKIFDSAGNAVAGSYNDDDGAGAYSDLLSPVALAAGTYTLVVSDFGGNMATSTTLAGTTFGAAPVAGYDYGLTINFVPEPSSLLLVGLAGLVGLRRRRR